jgi:hypothetical protein
MRIAARYNGPPGSGNGGWSAGVIAAAAARTAGGAAGGAGVEVTLRRPPPLDVELTLDGDEVRTPDGLLVAQVAPAGPVEEAVPPVSWDEAVAAARAYRGLTAHPFPGCYVCGPERDDGLRIFPGPLGEGRTAAPWTVRAGATPETVWAALDCPGGWAVIGPGRVYVLGRLAADVRAVPPAGAACVVVGAAVATDGRKARVLSTLYGPDGALLGAARATWVRVG